LVPSGRVLQSRYELQGLIERTQTFDLYIAKDLHFSGKLWFLKEMKLFMQEPFNKDISKKFQERASYLSRLDHNNLAKIVDYFIEDGRSHIVMEYTPGQSLKSMLKNSIAFSEAQTREIATHIGDAIDYLHNLRPKPVLLLNLNPSHIYLHKTGAILVEYGFSPFIAQLGMIQYLIDDGYGYCAPEMLKSKISVDNRTYLYSLNVILHHILTGLDPRENPELSSIRITNPDVSSQLDHLIKKCTEPVPSARLSSVSQFQKEILRIPKVKPQDKVKEGKVDIGKHSSALRVKEKNNKDNDLIGAKSMELRKKPVFKTQKIVFDNERYDSFPEGKQKKKLEEKTRIDIKNYIRPVFLILTGLILLTLLSLFSQKIINTFTGRPSPTAISNGTSSHVDYKSSGIEYYNNKDYIKAIENLTKAINQNPEDALAIVYRQNAYIAMSGSPLATVGIGSSLSGYNQSKGEDLLRGIALAQLKLNEEGINIQILVEDDQSTISGALEVTDIFCNNDEISAVIGYIQSDQAKTACPLYNSKKIVVITPVATCPGMDTLGPYSFRLSGVSNLQPDALARYCIKQAQFSKIAIMYDDTQDYSSGLTGMFKEKVLELGGTITVEETFLTDTIDFGHQIKNIIDQSPEVLFFSGYQKEAANVAVLLRENGSNLQIIGGDALYTTEIIDIGGEAVEGILFTTFFHSDYNNKTREFTKIFKNKFKVLPSARSALAYDALMMLAEGISGAGPGRDEIRNYLLSLNGKQKAYDGITGETYFDKQGNSYRDIFLITVKDGNFILVCKLD